MACHMPGWATSTSTAHSWWWAKKKQRRTYLPTFFVRFFEIFRSDFRNMFMVFLGASSRETAKNAIKKNRWEKDDRKKVFFLNFFGQRLLTWTSPKTFFWCF
jgi:hypothetical protein